MAAELGAEGDLMDDRLAALHRTHASMRTSTDLVELVRRQGLAAV